MATKPNLAAGKIGPFILQGALGEGYAAQVREAVHESTGQRVAIKIIRKVDGDKPELAKKMREREIAIMKLVDHPNIVRLYDVYETDENIYLVMELLEGTLFNYVIKRGRLKPSRALKFFQQIVEALDYMHNRLICHRDLKPENFLIGPNKCLKVCDFGFASMMKDDSDLLNTRCGTLHYASPDILTEGEGYNGRQHDVWSAGVNLFVMVTGELPFNDNNPKWLLRKIMSGSFTYPPGLDLPEDLKRLIGRMLKVDNRERITIPEIKKHPWFNSVPFNTSPGADINPEDPIEEPDELIVKALQSMNVGWDNIQDLQAVLRRHGTNQEKVMYRLLEKKKNNPSPEFFSSTYADQERSGRPKAGNSAVALSQSPPTRSATTSPAKTLTDEDINDPKGLKGNRKNKKGNDITEQNYVFVH
eukprot:TRINITY_DN5375_c1_g1_i2.p1 TRINITY_DN5375_c1_g1~~TRINITY_DN5375_c1_g1_i2.p1  ORF type:complete len:417 (+),score=115.38 TRINITY_DN5375_c1_g1_i2:43-1293(+)